MGTLRDQLLKAKLISDKEANRVKREQKGQRRRENRTLSKAEKAARRRRAREEQRREEQHKRLADQERERARASAEELRQQRLRLEQIATSNALPVRGTNRFYYVSRRNTLPYILVDNDLAARLSDGEAAIVELDEGADPLVVPAEAAQRLAAIDARVLRFFQGRLPAG